MLTVSILGPVAATVDERPVVIARPMHRAVLALLAVHAGRTVTAEGAVDALWGDDPPAAARSSLHAHVSRLRSTLGPEGRAAVITEATGYALRVPAEAVDVREFERLLADGRNAMLDHDAERAVSSFAAALALWRGPALSGVDAPFADPVAIRLNDLRLVAEEDRLEAELACGRHREVADRSAELVARNPFRERLWGSRMVALYRCGAAAEALAAFQAARRILADELGVDPSPELRRIEHLVLTHDAELAVPAPLRPRAPASPGVVVTTEPGPIPPVHYVEAPDGVHVAYQVVGNGPVDLIVSQSYVWQLEVGWEHPRVAALWRALAERYRLLLYDKRGQGLSDRVRFTDLRERALDVSAVLDAVDSPGAIALGNSDGTFITGAAAATDARILGLVSVSGGLSMYTPDRPWAPDPEEFRLWVDWLARRWGTGRSLRAMAPSHSSDPQTVAWMGRLERAACGPGEVRQLLHFEATIDWADMARELRIPALVLHRQDEAVSTATSKELADTIPGGRYVELPGDEHLVYLGDPAPLLRELDQFVKEVVGRPTPATPSRGGRSPGC